jgi:hypothetical protein
MALSWVYVRNQGKSATRRFPRCGPRSGSKPDDDVSRFRAVGRQGGLSGALPVGNLNNARDLSIVLRHRLDNVQTTVVEKEGVISKDFLELLVRGVGIGQCYRLELSYGSFDER